MLLALVTAAALAVEPVVIEGVDDLPDAATTVPKVSNVDFLDPLAIGGNLVDPGIALTREVPRPIFPSLIHPRESYFPEISHSVRAL